MYRIQNFRCTLSCLPFLVNKYEPFIESVQTINIPEEAVTKASIYFILFANKLFQMQATCCRMYL